MTGVKSYFQLGQLAEASYAKLDQKALLAALQDSNAHMSFSERQARELVNQWLVPVGAHQRDTESGFSSTLFRNTDENGGEYVLAIRGTKEIWNDLLQTDIADIVTDGIAINQTIDLYNEWRRLSETGAYQAAYLEVLSHETTAYQLAKAGNFVPLFDLGADAFLALLSSRNDIIIDEPSGRVMTVRYRSSTALFDDDRATGLGLGAEIAAHGLTVTGHSLGGHLATAFTRLFSSVGADAVAINGAGFATGVIAGLSGNAALNIRNLFSMLGGATEFSGEAILNLYGDKNLEFVTMNGPGLYQQGGHKAIFIEQDAVFQDTLGHGAAQMTDSLAAYDLFQTLQNDPAREAQIEALDNLKTIFETGTRFAARSLESLVNSVSDALNVDIRIPESGMDDREALYSAIYGLRDREAFGNLTGKLAFVEFEPAPDAARNDFAHFLSLYYLLPFKIEPQDAAVAEQLRLLHGPLGEAWQQDRALTESQRAQGLAKYSDQFLEDRAFMLSTLFRMNVADVDYGDLHEKTKFTVLGSDPAETVTFNGDDYGYPNALAVYDAERVRYVFGSDAGEDASEIVASSNNDHLYGMGGSDTIDGLAGSDYLEGGTGNDMLHGGEDGDVLVGGSGADSLRGGLGDDYLLGGTGADRILWANGDGSDFIGDYDDAGDRIIVNDIDLATLNFQRRSTDSPYYSDSDHPGITLHYAGEQLTISIGSGPDAGSITVMQYTPASGADFGIVLNNYGPGPDPLTAVVVAHLGSSNQASANQTRANAYDRQLFNQRGVNWAAASITFDASNVSNYSGGSLHGTFGGAFEGGPVDDNLYGNGNQNALHGLAGADRIDGRAGNDFLEGGAGGDVLFGGDGGDILFGSARIGLVRLLDKPTSYDQFYLSHIVDQEDDINVLAGDSGDDFVVGGEYADYMEGGTGIDYLLGGTGADYISGGAERDIIYGDSALNYRHIEVTPGVATERLEIAFAEGADGVGQYDDTVHAGSGNDTVWGEMGDDALFGEGGDDILFGDRFNHAAYFAVELPALNGTKPELDAALHGADELYGGAGSDWLVGLGGNDLLSGGTESDVLIGGAGDDIYHFHAGDGRDSVVDTEGNHTLVFTGFSMADMGVRFRGDQVFVGRNGSEEGIYLSKSEWGRVRFALGTPNSIIERSRLDTQYLDSAGNVLVTVKGTNALTEASRESFMTVDASDPQKPKVIIKSGVDEVKLEGIAGGSEGGRVRVIADGLLFIVELSALQLETGQDFLRLADGILLGVSGFSGSTRGTNYNDWIVGSEGADQIRGYNGDDVLDGRGGNDVLDAGSGFDFMFGGEGDDVLYGGQSWLDRDSFDGGRGSDTFYGGAGSDTYRFVAGDGTDRIHDTSGKHYFEFGTGVSPAAVGLYYTGTTSTRFRLEYGSGDALLSESGTSSYNIGGVRVGGIDIPLLQRSDIQNGMFYDTQWHDIFEPGAGTDTIEVGGWGNDVYRFGSGDGQDVLNVGQDLIGSARKGEIRFASGVNLDAITFDFGNADAFINYGPGDRITLETQTVTSHRDNTFVRFTLSSEANPDWIPVIRASASPYRLYGTFGKDIILGGINGATVIPGYGDDIIMTGAYADSIVLNDLYMLDAPGGIGHKEIRAGGDGDRIWAPLFQGLTVHYGRGDGNDMIYYDWSYSPRHPYLFNVDWEQSTAEFLASGEDTLAFGDGIALADLRFTRYGDSLAIQLRDGSGSVRIADFFHALDVDRGPQASANLFALMSDSPFPDVDTLLHPAVLASLPSTPIAYLAFADGNVVGMAAVLDAFLEWSNATVMGTEGADSITGTEVDEVIHTLGGNDRIEILSGSNTIDAGAGDDDIIVAGRNVVDAGPGNDTIEAAGSNVILAGSGDDILHVTGDNIVNSGPGDDVVRLYGGHNVIRFGLDSGYDYVVFTVRPGLDSTIVEMAEGLTVADIQVVKVVQEGADLLDIYLHGTDDALILEAIIIDNEDGGYTLHPHATVTEVRFSDGTVISGEQLFAMAQAPANRIVGTDGDDWLPGTDADDYFIGGPGNDVMYGARGSDYFYIEGLNDGADRIVGGEGFDAIVGGQGDDTIALLAMPATDSIEMIDGRAGVNVIAGTTGDNLLDFSKTQLVGIHYIDGKAGKDTIRGSSGNDVIAGGEGNDVLRGNAGNDFYLFGQRGGSDRIENSAPSSTEFDGLWMYDSAPGSLWFSQSGWDLLISVVGTGDQVKIANWYFSEALQLDAVYSGDRVLWRNQVDQLVSAMAGFDAPTGVGAVIPQSVRAELEPTLAAVWQQVA
jgi:Ca2+-binding RTX toxin-like protein